MRIVGGNFSLREIKILSFILSRMISDRSKWVEISGSDFFESSQVRKEHCFRALKRLIEDNIIRKKKSEKTKKNMYTILKLSL